jgi:hypothetical protein
VLKAKRNMYSNTSFVTSQTRRAVKNKKKKKRQGSNGQNDHGKINKNEKRSTRPKKMHD